MTYYNIFRSSKVVGTWMVQYSRRVAGGLGHSLGNFKKENFALDNPRLSIRLLNSLDDKIHCEPLVKGRLSSSYSRFFLGALLYCSAAHLLLVCLTLRRVFSYPYLNVWRIPSCYLNTHPRGFTGMRKVYYYLRELLSICFLIFSNMKALDSIGALYLPIILRISCCNPPYNFLIISMRIVLYIARLHPVLKHPYA